MILTLQYLRHQRKSLKRHPPMLVTPMSDVSVHWPQMKENPSLKDLSSSCLLIYKAGSKNIPITNTIIYNNILIRLF